MVPMVPGIVQSEKQPIGMINQIQINDVVKNNIKMYQPLFFKLHLGNRNI